MSSVNENEKKTLLVKLSCPCCKKGKITIKNIVEFLVGEAFIISLNKTIKLMCNKCGRKFSSIGHTSDGRGIIYI